MSSMDPSHDHGRAQNGVPYPSKSYALSGKIMLSAIIVLFFVVVLMVCLHLYARWYLLRARRLRRRSTTRLLFYEDAAAALPPHLAPCGLPPSVLKTLPLFVYSEKTHPEPIECAVCLSELEENETGRVLPKCNHSFHIECIDMWFGSHSTCPLCRSLVEPVPESYQNRVGTGPSSSAASGSASCRKPTELMIDIPERSGSFNNGGGESPANQFRSPVMARVLSFTRILSRERRPPTPSPRGGGYGASSSANAVVELDVERGREESRTS